MGVAQHCFSSIILIQFLYVDYECKLNLSVVYIMNRVFLGLTAPLSIKSAHAILASILHLFDPI